METFLKKMNLVVKPTLLKSMATAVSHSLCALCCNPLIFTPHNPYLHNYVVTHSNTLLSANYPGNHLNREGSREHGGTVKGGHSGERNVVGDMEGIFLMYIPLSLTCSIAFTYIFFSALL